MKFRLYVIVVSIIACENTNREKSHEIKSLRGDSICYSTYNISEKKFNPYYIQKYIYDTLGYIFNAHYEMYNLIENKWVEDIMLDYEYDNNNNNNILTSFKWNTDSKKWCKLSKYISEFNITNKLLTKKIQYNWNSFNEDWEKKYKDEYIYDSNESELICMHFKWSEFNVEWNLIGINISINEKDKKRVIKLIKNKSGNWNNDSKLILILNSKGDIREQVKFNFVKNKWIECEKIIYSYDTTISTSQIFGFNRGGKNKNKLNNTITFLNENNVWVKKAFSEYYYSKPNNQSIYK